MVVHHPSADQRSALRVVHATSGRLRLRGPARVVSEQLADSIRNLEGVKACHYSPQARSLLVLFEPDTITARSIVGAAARHAGVDDSQVVGLTHEPEGRATDGNGATFAAGLTAAFGAIDQQVRRTTRGVAGLGAFLPVALTLWAVREIALGRAAPLAWSSALWYAHGLFRDYNSPPAS
jgi:hypothetical protein